MRILKIRLKKFIVANQRFYFRDTFALFCLMFLFTLSTLCGCSSVDKDSLDYFKNIPAQRLLSEGNEDLVKRNYSKAAKKFESIDALYPFSTEAKIAQLNIIRAYYEGDEEPDLIISAADRYIHLYTQDNGADYAYYARGMVNFERGKTWFQKFLKKRFDGQQDLTYMHQSFVDFRDLVRFFPNSRYAKLAKDNMSYIEKTVVQRELDIARYYFKKGAYVAAANRAKNIIKNFNVGRVQVKSEARKILNESYKFLGIASVDSDAK